MALKTPSQRKKYWADRNHQRQNQMFHDKLNGSVMVKKDDLIGRKTPRIEDVATWCGCIAFPEKCLVIKGVTKVYKLYNKQKSLNKQYENKINNYGRFLLSESINKGEESFVKNLIVELDNNGLINDISKETGINKDIVEDIMTGTVINLCHCAI